jgi:LytS/YehU family sensor histidine kinase
MRFFYRIKNRKDSSWIASGDRQNILLTNIAPGNYKLELKVNAFDNKWPEQIKELEINVKPPFSRTWLFFILLTLIISTLAYSLYRYRIRQVKQKANIDKLLAQTEMKALHAQMNPHFIFNCLNSIREMILDNKNEQASLYLSKFARLIRITLNQSSQPFVSLTETIDYLKRYLEMEKIRSDHFIYTVEVGEDLEPDDIMLPPMLIQPFIENAIWHGAAPKHNLKIRIGFSKIENELVCVVEDDGIGIEESLRRKKLMTNEPSVGIENIKHRIGLLNEKYNLTSSVRIDDKSALGLNNGTGTIVTLHLTIKANESLWTN